jgi:hypothetical protein
VGLRIAALLRQTCTARHPAVLTARYSLWRHADDPVIVVDAAAVHRFSTMARGGAAKDAQEVRTPKTGPYFTRKAVVPADS